MLTKILAGFALALVALTATAQTSRSGSASTSGATATASPRQAQTAVASNQLTYNIGASPAVTTSTDTVRYSGLPQNAPDLVVGAYAGNASPDSCTGTAQGGLSVPGGSLVLGRPKNDPLCGFRRDADYRMRFANFELALGQAHPGLAADLIRTQLHDVYLAHVDLCQAEGGTLGECQAQAFSDVYPSHVTAEAPR